MDLLSLLFLEILKIHGFLLDVLVPFRELLQIAVELTELDFNPLDLVFLCREGLLDFVLVICLQLLGDIGRELTLL